MTNRISESKIAAVVVTYNRLELLKECLDALLAQKGEQCDIVVVDNNSTDGTREYLDSMQESNPSLIQVQLDNNIGGAGGFYTGIKKAYDLGYEYFWLMDDDTIPEPDALEKLVQADRYLKGPENYGCLSSAAFWVDGGECRMNRQKVRKAFFDDLDETSMGLFRLEQATFVSLFVPRRTVESVGLPIKEYFIWGDDIEYTRRIAVRKNIPSYFVPASRVVHKMKQNSGSSIAFDKVERIDRYIYAFRNDLSTYRREGLGGVSYYCAKCCKNFLLILIKAKDHRVKRTFTVIKGIHQGIRFHPEIDTVE